MKKKKKKKFQKLTKLKKETTDEYVDRLTAEACMHAL